MTRWRDDTPALCLLIAGAVVVLGVLAMSWAEVT